MYQFIIYIEKSALNVQLISLFFARFDEVDEANADKKPEVHNVVLEGKRKTHRLPFEEHLRPPGGKLTNKLSVARRNFSMFSLFFFVTPGNLQRLLSRR